jgi:hypothetical protein
MHRVAPMGVASSSAIQQQTRRKRNRSGCGRRERDAAGDHVVTLFMPVERGSDGVSSLGLRRVHVPRKR